MARMMTPAERAEIARIREQRSEATARLNNAAAHLAELLGVDPERVAYERSLGICIDVELAELIIARLPPKLSRDEFLIEMERAAAARRAARALESAISATAK